MTLPFYCCYKLTPFSSLKQSSAPMTARSVSTSNTHAIEIT